MGDPKSDLSRASLFAEYMVEVCGMSNLAAPLRSFRDHKGDRQVLSGSMAEAIDRQVNTLIVEAQAKAAAILTKHKADLIKLRDELIEKKTIEGARVHEFIEDMRARYPKGCRCAWAGSEARCWGRDHRRAVRCECHARQG